LKYSRGVCVRKKTNIHFLPKVNEYDFDVERKYKIIKHREMLKQNDKGIFVKNRNILLKQEMALKSCVVFRHRTLLLLKKH
jgi:hypothetical protein